MNEIPKDKVEAYEQFVNEKLKTDLKNVLQAQESIYSDIAEYLQIKDTIEKITSINEEGSVNIKPLETKIDLGCNFYAKAKTDNVSRIYIAIGYGFHLEMSFNEALKFIEKKVKILNNLADEYSIKASEIKANIKFVLEGLKEIQNLNFNPNPKNSLFI
jgi:prefoldin subunit 5